jgi:mannose-1-phosphate guanylyltransferase/mannose-1-phosphate guanylyltransferase/mannose-6-phosphate isomerase
MSKIHPVIMSGGSGSRLWPLSRGDYPKQFLKMNSANTLLQDAVLRLKKEPSFAAPIITCAEAHRFIIAEQLRSLDIQPAAILLEPCARSTAAVAALACSWLLQNTDEADPLFLLMPTDHAIGNADAFVRACLTAAETAAKGHLVTFGVKPDRAETGYGYIRPGQALGNATNRVAAFVEKPDQQTAEKYVKEGCLWNAGIFMFPAKTAREELQRLSPDTVAGADEALKNAKKEMDFIRLDKTSFEKAPVISVDYALMERTQKAAVVPIDMNWSDIGTFYSLWEMSPKDRDGNATVGDVVVEDTKNSLIRSEGRLAVTLGVENLLLMALDDVVLAADLSRAQDVKKIVERLKKQGRGEVEHSKRIYRPWGWFESLCQGSRFQVKRICVEPGNRLSLQMHHHRSEHWVVVAGTAEVQRDEEVLVLEENESIYLPVQTKHRLTNNGKESLIVIEVQTGDYLGEDDIVRFEDNYGRA